MRVDMTLNTSKQFLLFFVYKNSVIKVNAKLLSRFFKLKTKFLPNTGCRNPGLNQGPLDLQSNALPTELFRLALKLISNCHSIDVNENIFLISQSQHVEIAKLISSSSLKLLRIMFV